MSKRKRIFTKGFYEDVLRKAIDEAGPRYTPGDEKGAPNLKIKELVFAFDALGRTKRFYGHFLDLAEELTENNKIDYSISRMLELKISRGRIKTLRKNIIALVFAMNKTAEERDLRKKIGLKAVDTLSKRCLKTIEAIESAILDQLRSKEKSGERTDTLNSLRHNYGKLSKTLYSVGSFVNDPPTKLANEPSLLLLGEAGIGKTHFLCDVARARIENGYPTIILLGQRFQNFSDPLHKLIELLDSKLANKDFLEKLNRHSLKKKTRCLIMVDAINKGDKEVWRKGLNRFIKALVPHRGIGIALSCRAPFDKLMIPEKPKPGLLNLYHPGFREIEVSAQSEFFRFYNIPASEVPVLTPEFSHPLFLKLFCKSIEHTTIKKKHKQIEDIASGQRGMTKIFEDFVVERGRPIENEFVLGPKDCWRLLKQIAESMAEGRKDWIALEELKSILSVSKKKAFISRLVSEGLLSESLVWVGDAGEGAYIEAIRFPYQKFSDHLIARYLLNKYLKKDSSKSELKKSLSGDSPLGGMFRSGRAVNPYAGIVEALIVEFPTRIRNRGELFDYLEGRGVEWTLVDAFIKGLVWRDSKTFNESTDRWVGGLLNEDRFCSGLLDALLVLASKPRHPYNAERLNRNLQRLKMRERDLLWSEFLRKQDEHNTIYRLLNWIESSKANIIKNYDYARMYLFIMMWVLTSTKRSLRDRATRSLYYIGCKFPETLFDLTVQSLKINDPYVPERMLAASYGVAMGLQHKSDFMAGILPGFAKKLYRLIFKEDATHSTTHILTRDYARHTIEVALLHNPELLKPEERKRIVPPYKDGGIRRWKRAKDKNKDEYSSGNYPFGFDFNNYTIGYLLPKRGNYDFEHPDYIKTKANMWWRIYDLGYSLERFGNIDKEIANLNWHFGRQSNGGKTDRYGKKYCWIAWHEIAGYRDDKGLLRRQDDGSLERFTTDIDPSFPDEIQRIQIVKTNYLGRRSGSLPRWIEKGAIPDVKPYLTLEEIQGEKGPWVLLDGFINQRDAKANRGIFIFPRGLLVKKEELGEINTFLKNQDLYNRWLPEVPYYYSTFAGEIPWCKIFGYNGENKLEFVVEEKTQKIPTERLELRKDGRVLDHEEYIRVLTYYDECAKKEISKEDLVNFLTKEKIILERIKTFDERKIRHTKTYNVLLPVSRYIWESHHSTTNPGLEIYIPSKELSEAFGLTSRPQTFDLYDKNNRRASITLECGEGWYYRDRLVYLRKDLLERFLKDRGLSLIWAVWGERRIESKDLGEIDKFAKKYHPYKSFQEFIVYSPDFST